jgi:hypothetical protein
MRWILVGGLLALISGGLGCDSAECDENTDCTEVVCPDLTKFTVCKEDGSCFKLEDCPQGPGGW